MGTDPLTTKRCPRCEDTKPTTEFHKDRSKVDGLNLYCKPCRRTYDQDRLSKRAEPVFYVMTHPHWPGYVKVGNTKHLTWRMASIRGGMPVGEVVLEHRANHPDPESIQNLVFQRFPDRRRNGDWLEIEVGEVVSFVQALPQLQQKEVR